MRCPERPSNPVASGFDSREGLPRRLKDAGVLRLGRSNAPGTGAGTAFALVQLGDALADLFLSDDALAAAVTPETFLPHLATRDLYRFHLLPQLSERNVLSYAFASGMLAEACYRHQTNEARRSKGEPEMRIGLRPPLLVAVTSAIPEIIFSGTFSGTLVGARSGAGAGAGV